MKQLIDEHVYWKKKLEEEEQWMKEKHSTPDRIMAIKSEINRVEALFYLVNVNRNPADALMDKYRRERL